MLFTTFTYPAPHRKRHKQLLGIPRLRHANDVFTMCI